MKQQTQPNDKLIPKEKSHVFGKDIYLLGQFNDGKKFWLESASWDCDWYWGFGYIETYTNNNRPSLSRDINSHQHYNSIIFKKDSNNNYMYRLLDSKEVLSCVLTEDEQWILSDLMKSFYTLKGTAELFHSGNSHLTTTPINLKDEKLEDHINRVLLPKIFEATYKLLEPKN